MTTPCPVAFTPVALDAMDQHQGTVVVFCDGKGALSDAATAADKLTGGQLSRVTEAKGFKPGPAKVSVLNFPNGMAAQRLILASLGKDPDRDSARRAGGAIAAAPSPTTVCFRNSPASSGPTTSSSARSPSPGSG